jgi:hypothetical protein
MITKTYTDKWNKQLLRGETISFDIKYFIATPVPAQEMTNIFNDTIVGYVGVNTAMNKEESVNFIKNNFTAKIGEKEYTVKLFPVIKTGSIKEIDTDANMIIYLHEEMKNYLNKTVGLIKLTE